MRNLIAIFLLLYSSASLFSQSPLTVELACDLGVKLGGCAIGDVDPDHAGQEIVAVAADGRVFVIWHAEGRWQHEVAYKAAGELIQVAVGDADPTHEGLEIVAVGMAEGDEHSGGPGAVVLVKKEKGVWRGESIFQDSALVHGVAVAEGQVYCVGFSLSVHLLSIQAEGKFEAKKIGETDAPGKNAAFNSLGLHVCCTDGKLLLFAKSESQDHADTWRRRTLNQTKAGRARIGLSGKKMLVADDNGILTLYDGAESEVLHYETMKLRGAVFAQLDAAQSVMATVGYEGKLTIIGGRPRHRWAQTIYQDPQGLHHIAVGEVNGRSGDDLVSCGYAGRVLVVSRQETIPTTKKSDD